MLFVIDETRSDLEALSNWRVSNLNYKKKNKKSECISVRFFRMKKDNEGSQKAGSNIVFKLTKKYLSDQNKKKEEEKRRTVFMLLEYFLWAAARSREKLNKG